MRAKVSGVSGLDSELTRERSWARGLRCRLSQWGGLLFRLAGCEMGKVIMTSGEVEELPRPPRASLPGEALLIFWACTVIGNPAEA